MIRTITLCGALTLLLTGTAVEARTFTDTTFRTPDGNLVRKGMSKQAVVAAYRQPDDRMTLTGPTSCRKVELWTYVLERQVLLLTFTGKNVQQVKLIEAGP